MLHCESSDKTATVRVLLPAKLNFELQAWVLLNQPQTKNPRARIQQNLPSSPVSEASHSQRTFRKQSRSGDSPLFGVPRSISCWTWSSVARTRMSLPSAYIRMVTEEASHLLIRARFSYSDHIVRERCGRRDAGREGDGGGHRHAGEDAGAGHGGGVKGPGPLRRR
jgi:hypothetical protein